MTAIKIIHGVVNSLVLVIIMLLISFAGYALWDANQISQVADKANYAVYKPTAANQGKSFQELQALNAEVIAWLHVYGTNIDYPVTQAQDNMKYVNTNAEGLYSLSGSIFLDCNNSKDFSDFNSILYGHHMAKGAMFGDLECFSDRAMFDAHRYGNLYFNGSDHGIEFFALIHADAYDSAVFTPNVQKEQRRIYYDGLLAMAAFTRDVGVTVEDRIVLLSTCSSHSTNGRDILVGRLTDEAYDDPAVSAATSDKTAQTGPGNQDGLLTEIPICVLLLVFILWIRLIVFILATHPRWIRYRKNKPGGRKPWTNYKKRKDHIHYAH